MTPTPTTEPTRITMEINISYQGTVLMAIRVNIAIEDVKGTKEHTFIKRLSTSPVAKESMTTINPATNSNVIGITDSTASDKWLLNANLDDIDPAMGHCKGMEIASWLADNTRNDVNYVIIDDEYVCLESQVCYFVLTNPHDGITEDIADRVIAILNRESAYFQE